MHKSWHHMDTLFCTYYIVLRYVLLFGGSFQFSSVQSLSCVRLFVTPWIAARQASLSSTNSRSSLRLTSIESGMPSKPSHPLSSPSPSSCLQSFPASESFPMSQLFAWGGQRTGVSALASFLPNTEVKGQNHLFKVWPWVRHFIIYFGGHQKTPSATITVFLGFI